MEVSCSSCGKAGHNLLQIQLAVGTQTRRQGAVNNKMKKVVVLFHAHKIQPSVTNNHTSCALKVLSFSSAFGGRPFFASLLGASLGTCLHKTKKKEAAIARAPLAKPFSSGCRRHPWLVCRICGYLRKR
jgi:hypothetical protein